MKIGLLGFGVVGRGVYEITRERSDMQVTKVLCLEDINLPDAESVKDINLIVGDDSIDTVVEAMGGLHPAY
jgi:homoserine dehydrogenase